MLLLFALFLAAVLSIPLLAPSATEAQGLTKDQYSLTQPRADRLFYLRLNQGFLNFKRDNWNQACEGAGRGLYAFLFYDHYRWARRSSGRLIRGIWNDARGKYRYCNWSMSTRFIDNRIDIAQFMIWYQSYIRRQATKAVFAEIAAKFDRAFQVAVCQTGVNAVTALLVRRPDTKLLRAAYRAIISRAVASCR